MKKRMLISLGVFVAMFVLFGITELDIFLVLFFVVPAYWLFEGVFWIIRNPKYKTWHEKLSDKVAETNLAQSQISAEKRETQNALVEKNKSEGLAYCPKCKSTSITAGNKGFGLGKAAVGGVLLGPVGLLGGAIGSKKIKVTCLNCGYQFKPGRG